MRISFVIPAYNEEVLLSTCIESVLVEIERTNDPITGLQVEAEVVVVNNASTDGTRTVAERYASDGVVVLDEHAKGAVRARKLGFDSTSANLVAVIDADVIVPKGWLLKTLKEFDANKNLVALSGPFIYYDLSGLLRLSVKVFYFAGWLMHLFTQHVLGIGAMIQGGNVTVRRDALLEAGGFDTTTVEFYGDDTDLACRLAKVGNVKWTWKQPMLTTGRRLAAEGLFTASYRYTVNYLWVTFFGHPLTKVYQDIRPKK